MALFFDLDMTPKDDKNLKKHRDTPRPVEEDVLTVVEETPPAVVEALAVIEEDVLTEDTPAEVPSPSDNEAAPSPIDGILASIPNSDGPGTLTPAEVAEMSADERTEWVEGCFSRPDLTGVETDLDLILPKLTDPNAAVLTAIARAELYKELPAQVKKYIEKGWASPFPLPSGEKYPPAGGMTGNIPRVTPATVEEKWATASPAANTGLRMQPASEDYDIIALDVDTYDGKSGADTLAALQEELGELPATYMSTRRGEPLKSGHRFFRVEKGINWASVAGKDIDVLQMSHRYAVVWPSEAKGKKYRWYDTEGAESGVPAVAELPELPEEWAAYLSQGELSLKNAPAQNYDDKEARGWLKEFAPGYSSGMSDLFASILAKDDLFAEGGHDTMRDEQLHLIMLSVKEGELGLAAALAKLLRLYVAEVSDRRSEKLATYQFAAALTGAVNKARGEIEAGLWQPFVERTADVDSSDFEKYGAADEEGFKNERVKIKNRRAAQAAEDAEKHGGRVVRRKLTEFTPIAPAFLWKNMVPARGLTLATGEGGALKSSALRWMAAELTRGTLPGEFEGTPHGVMYIAGEEDVAGSVYASFKQSGADLDRVHIWSKEDRDANVSTKSFSVEQDMAELKQWCLDEGIRLVVVDPITQYFGSADINAQNETRQVLMPWTQLAEQIGGAVVGIAHTNKARSGDMALDVSGSAALTQVARAVLGFAKDDIGGVVSVVKSNVGPKINYEYSLRLDSVVMTNEFGRDSSVKVPVFELGALTSLTSAYVQTGKRAEKGGAEVNTTDIGARVVHVLYRDARNKAEELELKSPDFGSLAWREDDDNRFLWPGSVKDIVDIIHGEAGTPLSGREAKDLLAELKELGFVKQLGKAQASRYVPGKDEK